MVGVFVGNVSRGKHRAWSGHTFDHGVNQKVLDTVGGKMGPPVRARLLGSPGTVGGVPRLTGNQVHL